MSNSDVGPIQADCAYPILIFMHRAGYGRKAFKAARERGLRVRGGGRRKYVLGADFISFLEIDG